MGRPQPSAPSAMPEAQGPEGASCRPGSLCGVAFRARHHDKYRFTRSSFCTPVHSPCVRTGSLQAPFPHAPRHVREQVSSRSRAAAGTNPTGPTSFPPPCHPAHPRRQAGGRGAERPLHPRARLIPALLSPAAHPDPGGPRLLAPAGARGGLLPRDRAGREPHGISPPRNPAPKPDAPASCAPPRPTVLPAVSSPLDPATAGTPGRGAGFESVRGCQLLSRRTSPTTR